MLRRSLTLISRGVVFSFNENYTNIVRFMSSKCLGLRYTSALENREFKNFISCNSISYRNYAKSKDKKKEKKKQGYIDENELAEIFDIENLLSDMNKPINCFKEDLLEHTSLRTTRSAVENVKIHFEGVTYKVQDLAQIGKSNPKFYVLDFSSFPQVLPTVVSTFRSSELNVNVQQEGTSIIVPIPKVTKEHREVLAKRAKVYFQKCKEGIREVQFKYIKKLKNVENISSETVFRLTDQLTALADKHISTAESMLKVKHDELLKTDS